MRDVPERTLAGFDAVVHLAALSNDPLGDLDAEWTYDINLHGTLALARAAKEAGVRALRLRVVVQHVRRGRLATSSSTRTHRCGRSRRTPSRRCVPRRACASSPGTGFSPVSMRNATAYGVSPRLRLDIVLNNLVAWAHTTGAIRLLSDGMSWRPLVHVRDIARATLALLDGARRARSRGRRSTSAPPSRTTGSASSPRSFTRGCPQCEVTFASDASPDPRSYRVDFSKFGARFPDCRFEWTAERGADELAAAYERAGLTLAHFEGDRYIRLTRLKRLLEADALDDELRWKSASTTHHRER